MFQTRTMDMLEAGLRTSTVRREVIANNIANVDVPGFKRSQVSFEMNLKRALDSEQAARQEQPLNTNNPGHVARREPLDYRKVGPAVHTDYLSTMRNDGNNVDIEQEVMNLVKNQMQYQLMIDRIGSTFQKWNMFVRMA
ncbi:MAG: flagellar basal body rod protein FlgB [Leptospiraceae bacterium]|nr:flagellar basal body rod protein FlgB [Leptospiraceae bacterium]